MVDCDLRPRLSIVVAIPTKRRPLLLKRCLEHLRDQQEPGAEWRVVVIDNDETAPADKVVEAFSSSFPVPITRVLEPKRGYATVRNRALQERRPEEALVFLDDDMVASSDWIATIAQYLCRFPGVLVGTPCRRLPSLPTDSEEMCDLLKSVKARGGVLQGTAGLAIPPMVAEGTSFDSHFDTTGGEDTDLLTRLQAQGIGYMAALGTICIEEDRLAQAPIRALARHSFDGGRLFMNVRERNAVPRFKYRLRAAVLLLPDIVLIPLIRVFGTGRLLRRRVHLASRRVGVVSAPLTQRGGRVHSKRKESGV